MTTELAQGSDAWLAARLGRVTASRIADMLAKTKTGWGTSRANYAAELIAERLTGVPAEHYQNAAMKHGTDTEPQAVSAYEFYHDVTAEPVGFVPHPTIPMAGASPDRLVGTDGLVECKCPNTSTHIDTLLGTSVPGKYMDQMQFQMACTGRTWCDWVSFDPRMPESMRLFVRRVARDDTRIAEIEREVRAFLAEIDATVAKLSAQYEMAKAA